MVGCCFDIIQQNGLRVLTGTQATEDLFLMRLGHIASTCSVRVFSLASRCTQTRQEALHGEVDLNNAALRQLADLPTGNTNSIF